MANRIRFLREAQTDLDKIARWYQDQRQGLGIEFLKSVEESLAFAEENPDIFQEVAPSVRRCLTNRFPYAIYYRKESDRIIVLGIFHSSRSPRGWRRRIRKTD